MPSSTPDTAPYRASEAYGIQVVPTAFLVGPGGRVVELIESWDRAAYNALSVRLAGSLGVGATRVTTAAEIGDAVRVALERGVPHVVEVPLAAE